MVRNLSRRFIVFACTALLCSTVFAVKPTINSRSLADASDATKQTGKSKTKSKATAKPRVDQKTEQIALSLVNEHLPELKKLLSSLKKDDPRQYDLAIRDLVKSARKLDQAKNRDEELFEIEVEMLKTQSNVKLLAAKLKVRDSESDRNLLRKAVERLRNAEISKAEYNVRYLADRLERAQKLHTAAKNRLDSIKRNKDAAIEKSYTTLLKNAERATPNKTRQKRNAK